MGVLYKRGPLVVIKQGGGGRGENLGGNQRGGVI